MKTAIITATKAAYHHQLIPEIRPRQTGPQRHPAWISREQIGNYWRIVRKTFFSEVSSSGAPAWIDVR